MCISNTEKWLFSKAHRFLERPKVEEKSDVLFKVSKGGIQILHCDRMRKQRHQVLCREEIENLSKEI